MLPLYDHFGKMQVRKITAPMIRDAARILYPKASAATRNRQVITPMCAVINRAAKRGLCAPIKAERFKVKRTTRAAGDMEFATRFAKAATNEGKPLLGAAALFLFTTGARPSEMMGLTWSDLDLAAGTATIGTRKTGENGPEVRYRTVYLVPAVVAALASIKPEDRHIRLVFGYPAKGTFYMHWRKLVAAHGLPKLTPHEAGRHGFGTELMIRQGIDPVTTAELGGWESPRMLMDRYAHPEAGRSLIMDVFAGKKRGGE
ncbi:tyrosine-type recombinase/integrase [Pseudohoeflea coraliihabitans]|uniref:Site-specific integrase n=1 Tax=Pseudohoeflea coraliihabitans TaxID=2860393 RepID=A0ABS6WIC7_9HYPH|nr:site-specific integrase [Pseudohoeflea sp. DP4N28-3]MBW3095681.1 site-specific integrase [Pseudohoeflea sp. DP4N28-3]